MKVLLVIVVTCLVVVFSFPWYVKWHLSTFEKGAFYTLLNLVAPPKGYYQPIMQVVLPNRQTKVLKIQHPYAGKYVAKLKVDESLKFSSGFTCNEFNHDFSNSNALGYIESDGAHWLFIYSVPSQVPKNANCTVTIRANTRSELQFSITKFGHK